MSIEKSADRSGGGSIEDRVAGLNAYHSLAVYKYACRGLFEKHKLMLSLHLTNKILNSIGEWDDIEYDFFKGVHVMDRNPRTDTRTCKSSSSRGV